jgi:hypothetical protein
VPDGPRILFLDIETRPAIAYTWSLFDVTVSVDQIIDRGGTICFGAMWAGEKRVQFYSDWQHGHEEMVKQAHRLLSEADAVISYNGDKFDLPKLQGEFLTAGLPPPPPPTSIDVYKAVKKLGLLSNKLAFVGPLVTGDDKLKHEGFRLWTAVINGDAAAQKKMQRYCCQDVRLLAKVYEKIKAYIPNHPRLGFTPGSACGACGSTRTQRRGVRRTKASFIARIQCLDCGSWSDGTRSAVAKTIAALA